MKELIPSSPNRWRFGLRHKVALLFGMPVLIVAFMILLDHYFGEKKLLVEQATTAAIQTGSLILASMKHTMMINDHSMMESILAGTSQEGNITRIWIIDPEGIVQLSSKPEEKKSRVSVQSMGCIECHQYDAADRPRTKRIENEPGTLRVITPINNEEECSGCHLENEEHLGVLLTDISMEATENQLLVHTTWNVLLSLVLTVLAVGSALGMVNLLVVRRIEVMERAMEAFEKGDDTVRININWRTDDEFTRLADTFNRMVASIVRHKEEQQKITHVRQQAIMEERERIARELHDGVAQFLGYVNAKIAAISTLLDKKENQAAQKQIDQIMQAVNEQSVDVRASIVGLKLAEDNGGNLASNLRDYVTRTDQLIELPVELVIEPQAEEIQLNPEVELHLIRIVQEALSNIRKHSHANKAQVSLTIKGETLVLTIQDDGIGFNPWQLNIDHQPHFGLQSMHERAELAGAKFSLISEPGIGTTLTLQLRMEKT